MQQIKELPTYQYLGQPIYIKPVQDGQRWLLSVEISDDIAWHDHDTEFDSVDAALAEGVVRGRQLIENRW